MKYHAVYIVTNQKNGVLYTGVTSNLKKRIYEHKAGYTKGFSWKYNCKILVFYELHSTIYQAITREKQLKKSHRKKKLNLIHQLNPDWKDLYYDLT